MGACRTEYGPSKLFNNARISGSLHMTVQTAVLIETLKKLGGDMRWCSCNIFSTQDHAAAAIARDESAAVFAWKGESLEEYWECTLNAVTWPEDDGKGHGMDIIKRLLLAGETDKWNKMASRCMGVSEETTTGVHRLYTMEKEGALLFPAINVNDAVTKSKFDNLYGCKHSLPDGTWGATDVMMAGKKAVICGYGDVGKGCAQAMRSCGCVLYVTEIDPICALQACMEGFTVTTLESVLEIADIFVTTTGNKGILMADTMSKMKNNAIVGNIGHFDNEIDIDGLTKISKKINIKPQVDRFTFECGKGIIVLAEGRLLNLGCATGHPSFVMSCSFTNQTLAQIDLWREKDSGKYESGKVYVLPKFLDEKVARLHLDHLGAELTVLSAEQSEYIGIPVEGPYKPETYRY